MQQSIEESYLIQLEIVDYVIQSTIFPQCFYCNQYFEAGEVCVAVRVPGQMILRFHYNKNAFGQHDAGISTCWGYFKLGFDLFEENEDKMEVKSPKLM